MSDDIPTTENDEPTAYAPSELCPDDCPPDNAKSISGTFWRVCTYNPVNALDLLSKLEEKQAGIDPRPTPEGRECGYCAISVYTKRQEPKKLAIYQARKTRRSVHLATGVLEPRHGRQDEPSRKGHVNWWFDKGLQPADRALLFQVQETFAR